MFSCGARFIAADFLRGLSFCRKSRKFVCYIYWYINKKSTLNIYLVYIFNVHVTNLLKWYRNTKFMIPIEWSQKAQNSSKKGRNFSILYMIVKLLKRDLLLWLFFVARQPSESRRLHCWGFQITRIQTHHNLLGSSGWLILPSQRPLPGNDQHKTQISMPPAGFECAIQASERPQTHALDWAATGIL